MYVVEVQAQTRPDRHDLVSPISQQLIEISKFETKPKIVHAYEE